MINKILTKIKKNKELRHNYEGKVKIFNVNKKVKNYLINSSNKLNNNKINKLAIILHLIKIFSLAKIKK